MNRQKLLYIACAVACLLFAAVLLHNADSILGRSSKNDVAEESIEVPKDTQQTEQGRGQPPVSGAENREEADEGGIVVYVIGAVNKPGVYNVPRGTRVYQLLARAGGFAEDADRSAVNLAAKVKDGEQINFPSCVETAQKGYKAGKTSSRKSSYTNKSSGYARNGSSSCKSRDKSGYSSSSAAVDLNSASEEELDSLPGVGAKTAAAIVQYRQTHGRFERKEDLLLVKGIGTKKYEKLKDRITVGN